MAGLISKINRSAIGPLPLCYSPSLKMLIKSMLRKNPEQRASASELLKHPFLQPYVAEYRQSYTAPTRHIFTANEHREDMAESESSSCSSRIDRESLMASEIQEEIAETRVCGQLQSRDGLQGNNTSPANTKEAERGDVPKQPRVIKNIIKALKEGKGREITSPHCGSSSKRQLVSDAEPSCKRALDRTSSFHARTRQPGRDTDKATESLNFREEIMQRCRNSRSAASSARGIELGNSVRTPSSSSSSPLGTTASCSKKHHENSEDSACGEETQCALRMEIPSPNLASDEEVLVSPVTDASSSVTICHAASDSSVSAQANAPEEAGVKETVSSDARSFSERADALEGLLELCADLLEQSKLEELSVVLKPFGKEKVSPRDTAMWLAKSLKGMMIEDSGRLK
ncbi:hypothetical protein SASPL_119407 [Salvia splendens]|uniref:non-specific serine/threonine protein kinase n=1 Tax=Salvia splendens TaxID=180675 RepID=A0A8X8ZV74_SALSN|nr:hypothetical protein SASPL_119407 [Salvia splendens]